MEVGAVLGANDLEAIRDELNGWRSVIVLGEAGLASLAADRTPQVFVPLVSHGRHRSVTPKVYERYVVCLSGARLDIQIQLRTLELRTVPRANFGRAWEVFLSEQTDADFQARRHQRELVRRL
jgi:hypothetical protein